MDWHTYTDESEVIGLMPDSVTITSKDGTSQIYPIKVNGEIITRHLPVRVPVRYCKVREYNSAIETLAFMGAGIKIGDAEIKSPSIGVFSLMEMTNNPFPKSFHETTMMQKLHALYFNAAREDCLPLVRDWVALPDDYVFDPDNEETHTPLDIAAMRYAELLIAQGVDLSTAEAWATILDFFGAAWNGFEMIPGGGSSKFWFGAEALGSVVAGLAADFGASYHQMIWEIPIAAIGFTMVGKARQNGTKGIARPHCHKDMRRQMILAYLRELHGELHPWQIKEPLAHQLTDLQKKHPKAVAELKRLQEQAKAEQKAKVA